MTGKKHTMNTARLLRPANPDATIVATTPAIAEQWMSRMPRNRKVSQGSVDAYARDMSNGDWIFTGDTIKFDVAGNLIDGQHRLLAVIKSGVTVSFLIVQGLDASAQDATDDGHKRTPGDMLDFGGYTNSYALAAAGKLCVLYERGEFRTAAQGTLPAITKAELKEFVGLNPELLDAVATINSGGRRKVLPMWPAVASFALFTLRQIDEEQADTFFDDLANMRTFGSGDPKYALLRRLTAAKQAKERLSAVSQSHYVFRTWNALREGSPLSMLKTGNVYGGFEFQDPR